MSDLTPTSVLLSQLFETRSWLRGSSRERKRIRLALRFFGVAPVRWLKRRLGYRGGLETFNFRQSLLDNVIKPNPPLERSKRNASV